MSEQGMRAKVVKLLKPLDAVSVENPAYPGTPDVNYVEGWIELKWLREWPREAGVVPLPHFTPQQRVWLFKRWMKKGNVFMLIQCRKEWLLFDGQTASEVVGHATREELIQKARYYSNDGLKGDIMKWLKR